MVDARIEQQIERHATKFDYQDHLIWLSSYELKSGGWAPKALVLLPTAAGNGEQELLAAGETPGATHEEADTQAFAMAQQWIDARLAVRFGRGSSE
jgi:hypothetical protein